MIRKDLLSQITCGKAKMEASEEGGHIIGVINMPVKSAEKQAFFMAGISSEKLEIWRDRC